MDTTDNTNAVQDMLLDKVRGGDEAAWGELLEHDQERLLRSVKLRLDVRLKGRIDPTDVLQESFLSASKRRHEFLSNPTMPFFLWLRLITMQKLAELHRHHLGVKARSAGREVSLFARMPMASSAILAARLLGQSTTPSQVAVREETERQVRDVLDNMDHTDREIIALRNFEQLSNGEAALSLDIPASTASSRYMRALQKLKAALEAIGVQGI